jgi:hypothetical protein
MSSVIRLKPDNDPARPGSGADRAAGDSQFDSVPSTLPPRGRRAAAQQQNKSHLAPCAQCGSLNGRSATVCWSCEADLMAVKPRVFSDTTDDAGPAPASAGLPVPNPALLSDEVHSAPWELAEFEQPASVRRYTAEIVAAVCAVVFIGAGAYVYFGTSQPTNAATNAPTNAPVIPQASDESKNESANTTNDDAKVGTPSPAVAGAVQSPSTTSAPTAQTAASPSDAGAATGDAQAGKDAAHAMAIGAPAKSATPAAAQPAVAHAKPAAESRGRKTRNAQRNTAEVQAAAPPRSGRDKSQYARPNAVPPVSTGPCTATIAALGLCSEP